MKVAFTSPQRQFADCQHVLAQVQAFLQSEEGTGSRPVAAFEQAFAQRAGARYAIAVASGTDALFLSLKALGVTYGQEVITCATSFVSTASAIHTAGARVVLVDCNDKYVIDPGQVEAAISARTTAIIPVHYSGQPADLISLREIAQRRGVPLVEDACTALDATQADLRCGSAGLLGAFSFHPGNNLSLWGDGGMITTNSEGLYRKLQLMRNHGKLDRDTYAFFSYRSLLDPIQAVIGMQFLAGVEAVTARRIQLAARYDHALRPLPQLEIPQRNPAERHNFHHYMFCCQRRDDLVTALASAGVEARVHFPRPLHLQPAAAPLGYAPGSFPVTEKLARELISLPCHPYLSDEEQDHVISAVQAFYTAPA